MTVSAAGETLFCGVTLDKLGNTGVYLGQCVVTFSQSDTHHDYIGGYAEANVNSGQQITGTNWGEWVDDDNLAVPVEFDFDLDPHGGAAVGSLWAQAEYAPSAFEQANLTWQKWLCTLSLYKEADGYSELGSQEDYGCWQTVTLYALPPPDYDFDYWDGDNIYSIDPIANLYMAGEDHTATAHFRYNPPPPPPPGTDQQNDGGGCPSGQVGCTPIIVNLDDGAYDLTGESDTVLFDMNNDGIPVPARWTARSTNQAFLVFDRNKNGKIDNGGELFGSAMPLPNGELASNGFAALASLDTNDDGVIDERDSIFTSLCLWFDYNHNGVTDPGELVSLSAVGITRLSYDAHWTARRDKNGNLFRYEAILWQGERERAYYDVVLVGQ